MLNDAGITFLVSQLGYQIPKLIVYLVGFAMALSYMSRAPRASNLTLIGTSLLMVNTVGSAMVIAFLVSSSDHNRVSWWINSVGSRCLDGLGLGLLVAAIFVDRSSVSVKDRYLHE